MALFLTLFLALFLLLPASGLRAEHVSVPGPNGINLDAVLVMPAGVPKAPAIVGLHGCGGPYPQRDDQWATHLSGLGHIVLLPDSFGSRGLGSQCTLAQFSVTAAGLRRLDAIAAARWLTARPGTPAGGIALVGWSHGGSTVLATARAAPDLPPGLFRRFVAFYPGCTNAAHETGWHASAPVLILIGESDNWTPAPPCHELAAHDPKGITLIGYPGAFHDFDTTSGLHTVRSATGWPTVGTNGPARQDALARVPAWIESR